VFLYNCTRHYDSGKGDIIIKGTNRISMTKNDIDSKDEDNKTLMHGSDKTSPGAITMENYVKTITDILDKQEDSVILVGHSFNGITISRVAELRPEKIKSLVYLTAFLLPNGGSFFKAVEGV